MDSQVDLDGSGFPATPGLRIRGSFCSGPIRDRGFGGPSFCPQYPGHQRDCADVQLAKAMPCYSHPGIQYFFCLYIKLADQY